MKVLQVFSEPKRVLQAAVDSQNSPARRRKSRALRWLLLALIAPTTAQAATESWLDVQAWRATLTHEIIDHGTKQTSNTWVTRTTTWTVNQNLRIVYEFQGMSGTTNSRTWGSETNLGQQIIIDEKAVETSVTRTGSSSTTTRTSVPGYNPNNRGASLIISAYDNTYSLTLPSVAAVCSMESETSGILYWAVSVGFGTNPIVKMSLPGTNSVGPLSGSYRCPIYGVGPDRGGTALGYASPEAEMELTWLLEPLGQEDEELVVEIVDYDTWLPEGSVDERSPGNTALIRSRLQKPGGGAPEVQVRKFKMELISVSHEPGVCMNFPLNPPLPAQADLQFLAEQNPDWHLQWGKAQALIMESNEGAYLESPEALLSSFDWGAYGLLRVTAQLTSGRVIVGHLINDPTQRDIRIPRRANGSYIGTAWKEAHGVEALDDMNDGENDPAGDGHDGDGLTLYEEYRGFCEGSPFNHITGNPRKKDLFVRNRLGDTTGLILAESISGLQIHHKFTDDEFPGNRIMNANHSAGAPHRVDQHGVVVVQSDLGNAAGRTCGGPSIPKHIDRVLIGRDEAPTSLPNGKLDLRNPYAFLVAHELLHACNLWHHGPTDPKPLWRAEQGQNGSIVFKEGGQEIRILNEQGIPFSPGSSVGTDFSIWLGVAHGQHSGDDNCVMRYHLADAYVSATDPGVRYWVDGDEPTGNALCASPAGTGVNASGRSPQSRYGDATKGGCLHQLCINDAMDHPRGPQACP